MRATPSLAAAPSRGQTISSDRTHHGCIDCQLSTPEQREAIHNDFDAPGIPSTLNGQVKVTNHPVRGNTAATFPTDAGDRTLHCESPTSVLKANESILVRGFEGVVDKNAPAPGPLCDRNMVFCVSVSLGKRSSALKYCSTREEVPLLSGTSRLMVFKITKRWACSCSQTSP